MGKNHLNKYALKTLSAFISTSISFSFTADLIAFSEKFAVSSSLSETVVFFLPSKRDTTPENGPKKKQT
jgi:hypothetical protein